MNAGLKLNLSRDEEKHVSGAVDERIHKETDKWKKQTNKQRDRQRNKHKPYLNAGLKLNLCRDEKQHVAGAVDEITD